MIKKEEKLEEKTKEIPGDVSRKIDEIIEEGGVFPVGRKCPFIYGGITYSVTNLGQDSKPIIRELYNPFRHGIKRGLVVLA